MMGIKNIILVIIILLFIPLVSADALNPPDSVRIAGYISTHDQIGIWWMNPLDADFAGVEIWFDGVFIGTTAPATKFYYAEMLPMGGHILSTRTIDTFANINPTWVNVTATNNGYATCEEFWFCDDYCSPFGPIVTETKIPKTPIDPSNVSQGQSPTMMSRQYTDITLFYILMIVTLVFLLLSRNIDVKTIRPIMFSVIAFLTSVTMAWASLSIASLGDFIPGVVIEYTNQTNTQILHYQVVQVLTEPWITALCIGITIFTLLNAVDIGMRYIQRYKELDEYEEGIKIENIKI